MLKDIEAVIFDIDGTLIDSMWVWKRIDDLFLEKYHLQEPEGFHEGMEGMSYSETAEYFLRLFPSLPHSRQELEDEWTEMAFEIYTTQMELKTGAYDFIQQLKKNGIKLGIATSNNRELAEGTLRHCGVLDLFDSIWTSGEAKAGKPDPAVYLCVSNSLQVEPQKCLVFEDVPMGILAGKNAGMRVCAVYDDDSKDQDEKKRLLADYYIRSYSDIENNTYEVL